MIILMFQKCDNHSVHVSICRYLTAFPTSKCNQTSDWIYVLC